MMHPAYCSPHYHRQLTTISGAANRKNSLLPPSSKQHAQPRMVHSAYATRTRLLNRLGIFEVPSSAVKTSALGTLPSTADPSSALPTTAQVRRRNVRPSVLGEIAPNYVKLKGCAAPSAAPSRLLTPEYKAGSDADTDSTASSSTANSTTNGVHFNETVSVVEIPSRYQYSNRIKKVIWSDRYEISENAERNIIEFASEGYDWRNVVMDDEMYIDSTDGTLIHPCHFCVDDDSTQGDENGGEHKSSAEEDDDFDGFVPLGRSQSFK